MTEGVPNQRKVRVITKEEKEAAAAQGRDAVAIAQQEENQGQSGNSSAGVQVKYVTPQTPPQMRQTPTPPTAEQPSSSQVHEPPKPEPTVEQQTTPSQPIQPPIPTDAQSEEEIESSLLFGRAAITAAKGLDYPYVFRVSDGKQITIEEGKTLPENEIYFDFSILENVDDLIEDEEIPLPEEISSTVPPPRRESGPPNQIQSFGREVSINPVRVQPVDGRSMPSRQVLDFVENDEGQIEAHANPEMQAWSGILNFPNLEIYYHQSGIVRLHVDGKIKYSLGREGNVRILRIQKQPEPTVQQTGMRVQKVVNHVQPPAIRSSLPSTNAVKPGARSPNPNVTYRYNGPPPKQPEPDIPTPEQSTGDDNQFEF